MKNIYRGLIAILLMTVSSFAQCGLVYSLSDNVCNVPEGNGDDMNCPQHIQRSWKWVDRFGGIADISISGPHSVDVIWNGNFLGTFPAALNGKSYSGDWETDPRSWTVINFVVNLNGNIFYGKIEEYYGYANDDIIRVTVNGYKYEYYL